MAYINIAQYNILNSKLSSPDFYIKCDSNDLDPENRLIKIINQLSVLTKFNYIICLQEISQTWYGPLNDFFASKDYSFIISLYGNSYNDYMGIGMAYPNKEFSSQNTKIIHIGSNIPTKTFPKIPMLNKFNKFLLFLYMCIIRIISILGNAKCKVIYTKYIKPDVDEWIYSKSRSNTTIITTLLHKSTETKFVVATYHNPCAYWKPSIITIHSIVFLETVQKYAGDLPLIIAADLNFSPNSYQYEIFTKGKINENHPEHPSLSGISRNFNIRDMSSAYVSTLGYEPKCTNQTYTKVSNKIFSSTLDYIFHTNNCIPSSIVSIPELSNDIILPNVTFPSDHLLIGAKFKIIQPIQLK